MTRHRPMHRGVTLIELLCALVLLALLSAVATVAARRAAIPDATDAYATIVDSARAAAAEARVIRVRLPGSRAAAYALIEPDGSVIADSSIGVARLTGALIDAR